MRLAAVAPTPGEAPDYIAALSTFPIAVSILPSFDPGRSYAKRKSRDEGVDDFVVPGFRLAFFGYDLGQFGVHGGPL